MEILNEGNGNSFTVSLNFFSDIKKSCKSSDHKENVQHYFSDNAPKQFYELNIHRCPSDDWPYELHYTVT